MCVWLQVPSLKEPLSAVHGTFTVERDVVKLKDVRANAGSEGKVSARGRLPLTPQAAGKVRARSPQLTLPLHCSFSVPCNFPVGSARLREVSAQCRIRTAAYSKAEKNRNQQDADSGR